MATLISGVRTLYSKLSQPQYINNMTLRRGIQSAIIGATYELEKAFNIAQRGGFPADWYKTVPREYPSDFDLWYNLLPENIRQDIEGYVYQSQKTNAFQDLFNDIKALKQKYMGNFSMSMLEPLKRAMISGLNKKGYPVSESDNTQSIAMKFFEKIVKKSSSNPVQQTFESIDPITLTAIISAILNYFSKISQNPENTDEAQMAAIARNDLKEFEDSPPPKQNGFNMSSLMPILFLVAIIIAIRAFSK